jgi:hypothetical protein
VVVLKLDDSHNFSHLEDMKFCVSNKVLFGNKNVRDGIFERPTCLCYVNVLFLLIGL